MRVALRLARDSGECFRPVFASLTFSRVSGDRALPVKVALMRARTSAGMTRPLCAAPIFAFCSSDIGTPLGGMVVSEVRWLGSQYTPRNQWQGTPSDPTGWVSCGAYSSAVICDAVSAGGCRPTGEQVRDLTDENVPDPHDPGLNIGQLVAALHRFGVTLEDRTGQTVPAVWKDLAAGRYLSVSVWYPLMGAYRSQTPGEFGHQMTIGRLNTVTGKVMLFDPLNRSPKGRWVPLSTVTNAMLAWGERTGLPKGQVRYARSRPVPALA